ncbi:glycosyltransferase [Pelodictyon luteolum]|uniref:Glucosaminyltransferase n=1 Tax=Chlorobium luteolum (strain DSM 273 / BCRC 81028 / 2530) TaxID=319225 RepID=Q3B487_CHLL3|nr:glycosyltransferase [Pelodictyon luteolum]ABB23844.1 glucosaminyltransferase [Pelodictyon luteolum DSM 273]
MNNLLLGGTMIETASIHLSGPLSEASPFRLRHPGAVILSAIISLLVSMGIWSFMPGWVDSLNVLIWGNPTRSFPVWMHQVLDMFFLIYLAGSLFPFLFFIGLTMLPERRIAGNTSLPFVSVIIPSFNEEDSIAQCIESALALDYPAYEIIIVDDGSRDLTLPIIERYDVSVIRLRTNRGKVEALNRGIEKAKGEIIFFTDSDSSLDPKVLRYLVAGFSDDTVGAVAGMVLPKRHNSYLLRMQTIEYIYGQSIIKKAQLKSGGAVSICPGPATAFRRSVLLETGGYRNRTLAEDFDITLEMMELGYRAVYEPRAVSYTSAMTGWKGLRKQRIRWSRGHLQVYREHRGMMFSDIGGPISLFWMPWSLFIGYGSAFLEMAFLGVYPLLVIISSMPLLFLKLGLSYMVILECISAMQGIIPLMQARRLTPSLALASFTTQPYRIVLSYMRIVAYTHEMQERSNTW